MKYVKKQFDWQLKYRAVLTLRLALSRAPYEAGKVFDDVHGKTFSFLLLFCLLRVNIWEEEVEDSIGADMVCIYNIGCGPICPEAT